MHLALLVTNTDESDFAQRHPKDGVKYPVMMTHVRPNWTFDIFSVKDGAFPVSLDGFNGIMITGSPASVHDAAPWISRLLSLIQELHSLGVPMFGACFGHQAIALALGGSVGPNPDGYQHGRIANIVSARQPWMSALSDSFSLYGSHVEQVTDLPPGATAITASVDCAVSGFVIGTHVYTTQHHPEMKPDFIAALTDELADYFGPEITARARVSLQNTADSDAYAETIAAFFEQAQDRH